MIRGIKASAWPGFSGTFPTSAFISLRIHTRCFCAADSLQLLCLNSVVGLFALPYTASLILRSSPSFKLQASKPAPSSLSPSRKYELSNPGRSPPPLSPQLRHPEPRPLNRLQDVKATPQHLNRPNLDSAASTASTIPSRVSHIQDHAMDVLPIDRACRE